MIRSISLIDYNCPALREVTGGQTSDRVNVITEDFPGTHIGFVDPPFISGGLCRLDPIMYISRVSGDNEDQLSSDF